MRLRPATGSQNYDIVAPYAPAMVESLRSVGYDLPMAVADLVDNSLTAGANAIDLFFHWDGEESTFAIVDNGTGMTEPGLTDAMRVGSADPTEQRSRKDLGRFGLGLKTASFSQARRVTVHTRAKGSEISVRCWDLDYVRESGEWRVLREGSKRSAEYAGRINGTGTAVVWERMDRLAADTKVDDASDRDHFNLLIDRVAKHLAMVFHRFIEPGRVIITVNGQPVTPWDPFLRAHPATQHPETQTYDLRGEKVKVDAYILPHHSKLTPDEYTAAGGSGGWVGHQGFYVYRNSRLLVPGDWLALGVKKEEHYKLARIRIDLPNTLDDLWEIDVKKSTARVPSQLKRALEKFGRATRERAVAIYRHRGSAIRREYGDKNDFVWEQQVSHGKVFFRVNRHHPLVKKVLKDPGSEKKGVALLLRLIEESVPIPRIILANADKPEFMGQPFESALSKELYDLAVQLYVSLKADGYSHRDALHRLHRMEPFDRLSEFIEMLPEILKEKGLR